MPSHPYASKVYVGEDFEAEIVFVNGLKERLENGQTKYGRDEGRTGEYLDLDDPERRWYRLRCIECFKQIKRGVHEHDGGYFQSLGVVLGYSNAPTYPERKFNDFFKHQPGHNDHHCQCNLQGVSNKTDIVPLRLKPFIAIDDLKRDAAAPILGNLMRPGEITNETWDLIVDWVGNQHKLRKKNPKSAIFELHENVRSRKKIDGHDYVISRTNMESLRTWIPDQTGVNWSPLKFNYFNGKPQFKLPNNTSKIAYIWDEERATLSAYPTKKIAIGEQIHFGHFTNFSNPKDCAEWLRKCHQNDVIDVRWSGIGVKCIWKDAEEENNHWKVQGKKIRLCLSTFTRGKSELDIRFHDARGTTDGIHKDSVIVEYRENEDRRILEQLGAGSPPRKLCALEPNIQQIHCIEIKLGGKNTIVEFGIGGEVIYSIEVSSTEQYANYDARVLEGEERAEIMAECYAEIEDPPGFTPAEDVYDNAEDPLAARMWDILRFSCIHAENEGGIFNTSVGTRRLNTIREIMEWKDEESEFVANDGHLNNLATLFSNLMEWSRVPRAEDTEDVANRAQWTLRKPRLVGRDDLEWGILFDGRHCSLLLGEGIQSTDIYCMKNGIRLLKTEASIGAGIPISDRLPVMDECHSTAERHIFSILSHVRGKIESFEDRAGRIKIAEYDEYMLASPEELDYYSEPVASSEEELDLFLGLYSNELGLKNRNRWKGKDGWWKSGDWPVSKLSFDDGDISLHRFVAEDENFDDNVVTIIDVVIRFNDGKVVSMPLLNSDNIPDEWAEYARAGSKQESYRRYRFMRETVRSFLLAGVINKYHNITHPEEIPGFLRVTIPFEINSFIFGPNSELSRLEEISKFDPELAGYVSSNTMRQLWF